MKVTIYWDSRHLSKENAMYIKNKIIERFNIPRHTTVNGETTCEVKDDDIELLRECERRKFIQIRNK